MNSYNGFTSAEREAAQRWLTAQWAAGLVPRPSRCAVCSQHEGIFDCHAEDYSHPYGPHIYRWSICYRCHMVLHCRFKNPGAFLVYKEIIEAGNRYPPLFSRAFHRFCADHLRADGPRVDPVAVPLAERGVGFEPLLAESRSVMARRERLRQGGRLLF